MLHFSFPARILLKLEVYFSNLKDLFFLIRFNLLSQNFQSTISAIISDIYLSSY